MDNEKINDIPEEETEAVETAEEAVEETNVIPEEAEAEKTEADNTEETEEEISEETEEQSEEIVEESAEETAEEAAEESEEETVEEISEEDLCCVCGEKRKQEDSDYCEDCETAMLKRKIPFLGWLSGFAAVVMSLVAFVLFVLVSAPAVQIARGDDYAAKNCWYTAYNEYRGVSSIVDEVHTIIGQTTPLVQTGSGLNLKIVDAVANSYSPLEAISVAQSLLGDDALEKYPSLKKYSKIREDYIASYEAVLEPIDAMLNGGAEKETTYADISAALGQEGVNDVYINYFLYNTAQTFEDTNEVKIKYLDALEKSAGKNAKDYAWLYYQDYASVLYDSGDTEGAMKYLNALTESDKTKFGAYELKLRIAVASGDIDEANRVLAEFKSNNEGYDTAFVLEATLLRVQGEYERAKAVLEEALEQYDSVPELHRQLALIYLLEGDYDTAFEECYAADSNAYMLYAYMGDSSAYTPQLNNTLYLCSVLCRDKGTGTTDNAIYIEEILSYYSEDELSEQVLSVINGEKTVEQVLTEGVYDLA